MDNKDNISSSEYDGEILVVIDNNNYKESILKFCNFMFRNNCCQGMSSSKMEGNISQLACLLEQLPRPYTIVQEFFHIDRCFRDTYYLYFSNQHFNVERYSRRQTFIKGIVSLDDFFSTDQDIDKSIKDNFIGSCVINPLSSGVIGRTLINPKYLLNTNTQPVYVRLSKFSLHIYGKKFYVDAFPYRMQDEETMRCAEVTILNLIEYYSNSYCDYRSVVPSEILENEKKHNHERVLPSRGITYPVLSKVLSEFGFYPRLYNLSSIDRFSLSKLSRDEELKRWLHYYIESGIPVALNLNPMGCNGSGHSIVCIGHGQIKPELKKKAQKNKWISWTNKDTCHPIINSADFYEDYIVIDDNQPVYQIRSFNNLSLYPDLIVDNIAVPLYKRMFLDASDASAIVRSVLNHEHFGIDAWTDGFLKPKEDVIMRLFMASSHGLKDFRSSTLKNIYARETYALIPMPRFVWVCELYTVKGYNDLNAFGEIVIDATSVPGGHSSRSLIMMHYPNVIGVRYPDQSEPEFEDMLSLDDDDVFPGYQKNLDPIK